MLGLQSLSVHAGGAPTWSKGAPAGSCSQLVADAEGVLWSVVSGSNTLTGVDGSSGEVVHSCTGVGAWGSAGAVMLAAPGILVVIDNKGAVWAVGP